MKNRFATQTPKPVSFTKVGFEKIQKEYDDLKTSRPAAVEDLSKARAMGDLSENGYYKAAKGKLIEVDRKLRFLSSLLRRAKIIEKSSDDKVGIGSTVTLKSLKGTVKYHIVGDFEADPTKSMISSHSPIGRAILGKKVGDEIEVVTPSGKSSFTLSEVK